MNWMLEHLSQLVVAAGALGTAAFGIVEGLKRWRPLGEAGFTVIPAVLGPLVETLTAAYGSDVEQLLRAQYRGEQSELARVLRQGARIGLTPDNAERVARSVATIDPVLLREAAQAMATGEELPATLRNVIGRYELAVDARIDAALTLAQARYATAARIAASSIAVAVALVVAYGMDPSGAGLPVGALVGLGAVPLAPIAKDVVSAIKSAADALRAKMS